MLAFYCHALWRWWSTIARGPVLAWVLLASPAAGASGTKPPPMHASAAAEPAQFGAVGDGTAHPIGRRFGATLGALADYTTRDGRHPFAWVSDPGYGLTFVRTGRSGGETELAALTFAPAQDRNAAVQIILPGMTARADCLPRDESVRAVTAHGVLLQRPPLRPCPADTRVTFALAPGQVQALLVDWLGLQAAIAAARDGVYGGTVHIPPGAYVIDRPLVNPATAEDPDAQRPVDIRGDGTEQTRIVVTTDSGAGTCALAASDRTGASARSRISDLRLVGPGRRGRLGTSPAAMDGFCLGAKQLLRRARADGFHAGVSVIEDHWEIQDTELTNNLYGVYLAPGGDTFGNGVLRDVILAGNLLASVAVAPGNMLDSATLQNVHLGFGPYGFYREAASGGERPIGSFVTNSLLENVWGEALGDGFVTGENHGTDVVYGNVWINVRPVMDTSGTYRLPGRTPDALVSVGRWTENDMIRSDFGDPANYRNVGRALLMAADTIQGNAFGRAPTLVDGSSPAKPALAAPVILLDTFDTGEASGRFMTVTAGVHAGEILADAGFDRADPAAPGRPIAGVALAAGGAGDAVPVASRGLVSIVKGTEPLRRGTPLGLAPGDPTRAAPAAAGAAILATVWEDAGPSAATVTAFLGPFLSR